MSLSHPSVTVVASLEGGGDDCHSCLFTKEANPPEGAEEHQGVVVGLDAEKDVR
jgi:hypothetical protein